MKFLHIFQSRAKVAGFLKMGIWEVRLKDLPGLQPLFVRYLRTVILSFRSFRRNDSLRTASVLTYYSVLNFIPLLAVVFAIAKGFGLRRVMQNYIMQMADTAHLDPEMANQVLIFANSVLKHARGGVIAGVGIALLLWTVISILGKIEDSFNRIWEVKRARTLVRQFTDYMSILVVVPILFAVSASATVVIAGQLRSITNEIPFLGYVSSEMLVIIKMLPYLATWALLIVLYMVMPNTKVSIRSGLLAGVIAGTGLQIIQFVYLKLQMAISGYSAVYGTFAAMPLFLGWLQISWMIVFYGAEIAHASEYSDTFGIHPDHSKLGGGARRFFMVRIFHLMVKQFQSGESPLDARGIAGSLQIPLKLVEEALDNLKGMRLIIEVVDEKHKDAFQPARPVEDITIDDVLDAYEKSGEDPPPARSDEDKERHDRLKRVSDPVNCPDDVKLLDL
jgi:membrane protein